MEKTITMSLSEYENLQAIRKDLDDNTLRFHISRFYGYSIYTKEEALKEAHEANKELTEKNDELHSIIENMREEISRLKRRSFWDFVFKTT